ncbi:MAG: hypothetical protein M1838_001088 [Thelocarpon superellum]|nr:MAG: hypothetical protein M1838_001088 [Thelocarpon superellum]
MSIEHSNIWFHAARAALVHNERYYADSSEIGLYEVAGGEATFRPRLQNGEIQSWLESLKAPSSAPPVQFRVIFINPADGDTDRINVTAALFEDLVAAFGLSPRFVNMITRQHTPSRSLRYDASKHECYHEFWYSAIIRTCSLDVKGDLSKRVMGWSRVCVWAGHDLNKFTNTIIALRIPDDLQRKLVDDFRGPQGSLIQSHPMFFHAIVMQDIAFKTYDFLEVMSAPVYTWENYTNRHSDQEAFSRRSQAFLELSRQITQVATDYDILTCSLRRIQQEHLWLERRWKPLHDDHSTALWRQNNEFVTDMFRFFLEETQLCRMYGKLYEERSKIGINEGFAMLGQKDAELNLRMAAESTDIARATRADSQSLRVLQILGVIFLPASVVSSIFGMSFFSSQPDASGGVTFQVSEKWWYFLVVAVPLSAITFVAIWLWNALQQMPTVFREPNQSMQSDEEKLALPSIS